jgi:hypothetical protein
MHYERTPRFRRLKLSVTRLYSAVLAKSERTAGGYSDIGLPLRTQDG